MNKEGSFKPIAIILLISMVIAFAWDSLTFLKNFVHSLLDPSLGAILQWNMTLGMLIIILIITIITTLVQKYTTDQKTLKELKDQQKEINKKAKELQHDPQKMLDVQKEMGPITIKMLKLNARSMAYTAIPIILTFRWFNDYFESAGGPVFFGFMGWFIFYLLFAIIFGALLKKVLKVV